MKTLKWFIRNIDKAKCWHFLEIVVSKTWTNYFKKLVLSEAIKRVADPEHGIWANSLVQFSLGICRKLIPGCPAISKSWDAQVPYVKWSSTVSPPYPRGFASTNSTNYG